MSEIQSNLDFSRVFVFSEIWPLLFEFQQILNDCVDSFNAEMAVTFVSANFGLAGTYLAMPKFSNPCLNVHFPCQNEQIPCHGETKIKHFPRRDTLVKKKSGFQTRGILAFSSQTLSRKKRRALVHSPISFKMDSYKWLP